MKKISLKLALLLLCCLTMSMFAMKKCQALVYPLKSVPHSVGSENVYRREFFDNNYRLYIDIIAGDAGVETGMMEGDELVVPDSVSYRNKIYPVTAFIRHIPYSYDPEYDDCLIQKYKTLTLPDSVKTINVHNFPGLQTVNIPKDMSSIYLRVKQRVHYLVPEEMTNYYLRNNALYSKKERNKLIYTMNIPAQYKIDEGTDYLGDDSFCSTNRYHIEEIVFPVSMKKINYGVFSDCENLKRVNLSKVKVVAKCAFEGCEKLKSVTLEGTTKMPKLAEACFVATHSGIKFHVKNKKMAKQLKKKLKGTMVRKAKIYVGNKKKPVYKNING